MRVIADLHMHSKYAMATSKYMDLDGIASGARIKGISVMGSADFLHPVWQKELKEKLSEANGVYEYKGVNFILTGEVSLVYKHDGKGRRVHHIIMAPSFEILGQITEFFLRHGRVDYDGRPIFGMSSIAMTEALMQISKDIEIIPAHCLVPGTFIHTNPSVKRIEEIVKGDKVLTHRGNFKKVIQVFARPHRGKVFKIVPWYFSEGITVTPEHPFIAIKTDKKCSWTKGLVCKPTESHKRICHTESYKKYKKEWIQTEELEVGDILVYPKIKETVDVNEYTLDNNTIQITNEFCRLAGYYLAEGYTNSRDAVCFAFNKNESDLIEDVTNIMKKVFHIENKIGKTEGDIIFYSKQTMPLFQKLFYASQPYKAQNKALPHWMLTLPVEKQKEILIGWWRGDEGYTTSRLLANQMKSICLRLNIIPSMRIDTVEKFTRRGKHTIGKRKVKANFDSIVLDRLSFLEDRFNILTDIYFKKCKRKIDIRHGWSDKQNIYIPVRKIEVSEYNGLVYNLEVEDDNSYVTESAAVHNCWTPWFSVFGSMSGFNSLKECFGEYTKHIHAIETGLSSDPLMNWRLSQLDDVVLVSNSDSHSAQPHRLGREANVFDLKEITYKNIIDTIRTRKGFSCTIEVDPNFGKYHFDGHRNCNFSCSPQESKKLENRCPHCKEKLIIGVLNRVEELADRPEGFRPKGAIDFKSVLPLMEVLSSVLGVQVLSKKVNEKFNALINAFGNEFNILLDVSEEDLKKVTGEKIASAIMKNREGKIKIIPGYDGVYGIPIFDEEMNTKTIEKKREKPEQKTGLNRFV